MPINKKWSVEDDEALGKALADGVSVQRLAVRFKTNDSGIQSRARQLGLKIKPQKLTRSQLGYDVRK